MIRHKFLLLFIFFSSLSIAQDALKVSLFNEDLNTFQNVRDFSISSDGKEAFFTIQSLNGKISQIVCLKKVMDKWSEPKLLAFNNTFMCLEPFLSEDGKRLFFVSDRPLDDSILLKKDFDIWYVKRNSKNEEWSKPINLGRPVNSKHDEFYPSLSKNNNLYFTLDAPNGIGKDDIYFSKWDGKNYTTPKLLNTNINSEGYEFNALVSSNENFIIYSKYNAKGGYGSGDLYISRKDTDGNWQHAENLGNVINPQYMEYCPFYDEKNKTLYFTSKRNSLLPKDFKNITELEHYLNSGQNGSSKIYKVKIDLK